MRTRRCTWRFAFELDSPLDQSVSRAAKWGTKAPSAREKMMNTTTEFRPICTIGHSTRTIEEFVELLRSARVQHLVDVRSIPRSRTNPQYNLATLPDALAEFQIGHTIIPSLGGRRGRAKSVDPAVNAFWKNQSFHNYADHALSADFLAGLDELKALQTDTSCAIMCSEAVWWRCHRRIIADYLLAEGWSVMHIMGPARMEPAKITSAAARRDGKLVYPASAQ